MGSIEKYPENVFESIKHIDENGNEYWEARELQSVLGYKEWRYFSSVIEKAQIACLQSKNNTSSNFGVYTKIVKTGVGQLIEMSAKLGRSTGSDLHLRNCDEIGRNPKFIEFYNAVCLDYVSC